MTWWTSVVDGVKAVGNGLGSSAKWIWNNVSIKRTVLWGVNYTANTVFQTLEQGLALRTAVPALINNLEVKKIVNSMTHIAIHDVLPLVTLNAINNSAQAYFRDGYQEDESWLSPYSMFLTGLTVVNCAVTAYTWRQGTQASIRLLVLDSSAPSAFNSHKKTQPLSLCNDNALALKCNAKRKAKGGLREPAILVADEILGFGISWVPYVGETASTVLSTLFMGRYITRAATPERCERHKAMMQESVLALGLSYAATNALMDMFLEATVGMPPFLYLRIMRHLLLLLHINLATHMSLPLVYPKDETWWNDPVNFATQRNHPLVRPKDQIWWTDPVNFYEQGCRFIADVIWAGLMKRVPIDFKPEKDAPPLIPLSPTLKLMTNVLKSDLESEQALTPPGYFKQVVTSAKPWVLPPMLRDIDGFVNDPIIHKYWPSLREGGISAVDFLHSIEGAAATLAWAPKSVAAALYIKFGVSKKLTRFVLMLSQESDFWELADALKAWFERHNLKFEVKLVNKPRLALHGQKEEHPLPKEIEVTPLVPVDELRIEQRSTLIPSKIPTPQPVITMDDLTPAKKLPPVILIADNPDSFFTTKRRGTREGQNVIIPAQELFGHGNKGLDKSSNSASGLY